MTKAELMSLVGHKVKVKLVDDKRVYEGELFYWDNGWCSLGSKEGNGSHLIYDNVPDGALFMVKNKKWKSNSAERIFIYKDGEILWY